jgi:hypothetical protein
MRRRGSFLGVVAAGATLVLGAVFAMPAAGEMEIVSQQGVVAVSEGQAASGLRRQALADAIARAVDGLARRMVEAEGAASPTPAELDTWLGDERREYTSGFRVVSDLGARAPQILEGLGEGSEYAVLAEVTVDAERIRRRLVQVGVVRPRAPVSRPSGRLLLILEPLDSYAAYAYVRETLGAVPVEFTRGRAVLGLETDLHPEAVVERLRRTAPEDIRVGQADWDGATLRLEVRFTGPPEGSGAEPQARRD